MLQNVTWLAIVDIHTAENEPPKVRQVMNKIHRNVGPDSAQCQGGPLKQVSRREDEQPQLD